MPILREIDPTEAYDIERDDKRNRVIEAVARRDRNMIARLVESATNNGVIEDLIVFAAQTMHEHSRHERRVPLIGVEAMRLVMAEVDFEIDEQVETRDHSRDVAATARAL